MFFFFYFIALSFIQNIYRNSFSNSEIGESIEDFLTNVMYTLSEREFVIDYHNLYPFTEDFQLISELYSDLYPLHNNQKLAPNCNSFNQ